MTTIYEVATRAGVSLSTVSRVLNGNKSVNPAMAEKVKQAASELHYTPSQKARSLASKHSHAIGIVLPNKHMLFASHLLFSFEHILRQHEKHCVIAFSHDTVESEVEAIEFLLSQGCDGVVVTTISSTTKHLHSLKDKIVTLSTGEAKATVTDLSASVAHCVLKAHHLLTEQGHTDIALVNDRKTVSQNETLLSLFKKQLIVNVEVDALSDPFLDPLLELMAKGEIFSAIICTSDVLAERVVNSARELGMVLPSDLSIILSRPPNAHSEISSSLTYNVSSVAFSTLDMASAAAKKCFAAFYDDALDEDSAKPLTPIFLDYGSTTPFS